MKTLFAYNAVTLLNCAKVNAKASGNDYLTDFYNVPFSDIEEMVIEFVLQMVALYPLPFFSLQNASRPTYSKDVSAIWTIWQSHHIMNGEDPHALTITSGIKEHHQLHDHLCLTDTYWPLLNHRKTQKLSDIWTEFSQTHLITKVKPYGSIPMLDFVKADLPHYIVSLLTSRSVSEIKQTRELFVPGISTVRKTNVQARALDRNSANRLFIFIAYCYFLVLVHRGYHSYDAFLRALAIFEYSPTVLANKSDDCHLPSNFFHWLMANGNLTLPSDNHDYSIKLTDFPDSMLEFFNLENAKRIPTIKNMGTFYIPDTLNGEHKRLLMAINEAILTKGCFNTVLQNYIDDRYK